MMNAMQRPSTWSATSRSTRLAAWLVPCLFAAQAVAQTAQPVPATFVDVSSQTLPDGRFQALIAATVPGGNYDVEIGTVQWTGSAINVTVIARENGNPGIPTVTRFMRPLALENLPAGTYPIRLSGGEVTVTVPAQRRLRQPLPARIWPEAPNELDPLWLVFEPLSSCDDYTLQNFIVYSATNSGRIILNQTAGDCPEADAPPRLHAVRLGTAPAGEYALDLRINRENANNQVDFDGRLTVQVQHGLNERVAGAWYDPSQPGQGLDVHLTQNGEILLYWFTFDIDGNPAWIQAQGHPNGRAFPLMAYVVTGGRFPPRLDPEQVELQQWGQLWLDFETCDSASLRWDTAYPGFDSGEMALSRLTSATGKGCEAGPPDSALVPAWYPGDAAFFRLPDVN